MRGRGFVAVLALLLSVTPAQANYWEGHAAFRRGDYQTAHREFLRLAELGHAAAQFNLGYLYQHGLAVPRDPPSAVRWYLESARRGRVEAQFSLGALYETGTGVARNLVLAYRWYNLAASNVPPGEKQDRLIRHRKRIFARLTATQQSAVETTPAPAGFILGADLAVVEAAAPPAPAVIDIQRELAARKFNPGAMDGRMGSSTVGALSAFQASKGLAVTGEADAPTVEQLFGPEEVAPHLEPFPRTAAVRKNPAPPAVPVPPVEAMELEPQVPPELVAEAPAPEAPAPETKAPQPVRPAATATAPPPQKRESKDVTVDLDRLRRLAEQGNATAQINLATRHHYGQGVAEDHAEAAKWYAMAAEQGRVDAMFPLGSLHETGAADQRDLAEAYKWYRRAAELVPRGKAHEIIVERRDRVAEKLTPAQLAAADRASASSDETSGTPPTEPAPAPNRAPTDLTFASPDGATLSAARVAEITTDGSALGTFRAADPDDGEVLTYRLSEDADGRFAVDAKSGILVVRDAARLDFEAEDSHEILVRVTDTGGLAYEESLVVALVDINEPPTAEAAGLFVPENAAVGTVLGRVKGLDPDAGANGKLSYALAAAGPFAIDAVTGEVTVAEGAILDFERQPRYGLTVTTSDGGGLRHRVALTVTLEDRNEAPHGIEMAVGGTVTEHVRAGTVVGRISASDPDTGDRLIYSLAEDAGGRFTIDPETGTITVAEGADLDFENAVQGLAVDPDSGLIDTSDGQQIGSERTFGHRLLVRVADAAGLAHEAAVAVEVVDLNESPWAETAAFTLDENAPAGTAVGRVEAGDPDGGKNGRLRFALGDDGGGGFAIDAETGEITVADGSVLDFEARSAFELTLAVSDGGGRKTTAVVSVDLRDSNEPPEDLDMTGGTVAENAQGGATVATLMARDPDAGDRLTYSLTDDGGGGRFAIDAETGAITVAEGARLNFNEAASHEIGVRVSDAGGLSYTESITLVVTDENQAPTAIALAGGTVPEDAAAGTLVAKILASDPDAGERLTYRLVEDAGGRFVIDAESGHIAVNADARLDHEDAASHQLKVQVVDSGGLVHDEALAVVVVDVNEAPRIAAGSFVLDEIAGPGTTVGRLRADDPDSGANGALRYAITGDNSNGRFAIDPTTGVVVVAGGAAFDFEDRRSFKLVVTATDGGGLMDSALLAIALVDRNEPPAGLRLIVGRVPESAAGGQQAGQVLALDPDAGDRLSYALTEDAGGRFAIDSETGIITVADGARLDFEAAASHRLAVRVTDSGGLAYDEIVTVALTDSNEPPTVKADSLAVWENAVTGTAVGRLGASDPDAGDRLTFALADDADGRFAIDRRSGDITVADGTDLDYETDPRIEIIATVTDRRGLSDTAVVAVDLADRNEAPSGAVTIEGMVAENAAEGTLATTFAGRDPDAGDRMIYSLANDAGGRFAIDAGRGLITVAKGAKLDFEARPFHWVGVQVTDSGGLSYEETLTIALLDVDETAATLHLLALDEGETNGHEANGKAAHQRRGTDEVLDAVVAAQRKLTGNGHTVRGQGNRVAAVQAQLIEAGFDPGPVDGKMGPRTRAALSKYQETFRLSDLQHEDLLDHLLMLAHFQRGYDYQRQGEFDKSISEYSEVIRLSPDHFSAYYNRGLAHFAERRYGQARLDFEKVIEVRPNYAGAFVNRGNVYYRQGLYVRAAQDYATALGIWITPW